MVNAATGIGYTMAVESIHIPTDYESIDSLCLRYGTAVMVSEVSGAVIVISSWSVIKSTNQPLRRSLDLFKSKTDREALKTLSNHSQLFSDTVVL